MIAQSVEQPNMTGASQVRALLMPHPWQGFLRRALTQRTVCEKSPEMRRVRG